MFFPEGHIRVYLYGEPVDMSKSFDGLYALARQGLQQDPLLAFAYGHLRASGMLDVRTEAEKYGLLAALSSKSWQGHTDERAMNLVECIAFSAPSTAR